MTSMRIPYSPKCLEEWNSRKSICRSLHRIPRRGDVVFRLWPPDPTPQPQHLAVVHKLAVRCIHSTTLRRSMSLSPILELLPSSSIGSQPGPLPAPASSRGKLRHSFQPLLGAVGPPPVGATSGTAAPAGSRGHAEESRRSGGRCVDSFRSFSALPGAALTLRSHGPTDVHAPDALPGTSSFTPLSPSGGFDCGRGPGGPGAWVLFPCSGPADGRPVSVVAGTSLASGCFSRTSAVRAPGVLAGRSRPLFFRATTFGRRSAHLLHSPPRSRTPTRSSPCNVIRSPPAGCGRAKTAR